MAEGKGYVIALDIYKDIVERNNLDTDEPIKKDSNWLKNETQKSLEALY